MHEQVDDWTGEQQQPGQHADDVCPVLGPQEVGRDDQEGAETHGERSARRGPVGMRLGVHGDDFLSMRFLKRKLRSRPTPGGYAVGFAPLPDGTELVANELVPQNAQILRPFSPATRTLHEIFASKPL
jgi:hypothetical protein